jgi:TraM recognition site of TraD and TraG
MFADPGYRSRIVKEIRDPRVREFWEGEFPRYGPQFAAEIVSPVQNKIGTLLASPAARNMLGQATSTIDIAEAMDHRRIIVGNLAKGRLGEGASNLIGSVLISAAWNAAMRRTTIPEENRVDFVAYLDEFQSFGSDVFTSILAEARKYRLSIVLAHQYLEQVSQPVRAAVFGNCGTLISFGVGHADADEIAPEFDPYGIDTLTMMSRGEVCVRSLAAGETGQAFLGATIAQPGWSYGRRDTVVEQSQRRWGTPRHVVEGKIGRWSAGS